MFPVYKIGITMNELPDFISFYVQFHSCTIRCNGCHSRYLWDRHNKYVSLDYIVNNARESEKKGADSVILFGDINNGISAENFNRLCKELYNIFPVCVYSGANNIKDSLGCKETLKYISYIKLGNYDYRYGGLYSKTTNQHLYRVIDGVLAEDITSKFWG